MSKNIGDYLPLFKQSETDGLSTPTPITFSGTITVSGALNVTGAVNLSNATAPLGTQFVASYVGQTTEAATDRQFFVAPRACTVVAISEVHAVAAGGASALQVVKDTGTAAPGAGTDLLTNNTNTGFDLNATAQTVQVGTLSATASDLVLAAGNRLSIDFANTIQSTAGLVVTVLLKTS